MSITLENERLKNEVYELRRLLSMQDNIIPSSDSSRDNIILQLHEDLDGQARMEALEKELIRAKEVLDGMFYLYWIKLLRTYILVLYYKCR